LNEAFGLAVGARRIGSGEAMADAEPAASGGEEPRAIARAVVGEQAAKANAERTIVADRGLEERDGRDSAFVGQNQHESKAGVVVDGDVNELPTGAAATPGLVAGGAMTGAREASELLDVEMKQVAGTLMFVAADGRGGLEITDAVEALAAQDAADGGRREADELGDAAAGVTLPPQGDDAVDEVLGGAAWAVMGPGRAVEQTGFAFVAVTFEPAVSGA